MSSPAQLEILELTQKVDPTVQEVMVSYPAIDVLPLQNWFAKDDLPSLRDVMGLQPLTYAGLRAQLDNAPRLSGRIAILISEEYLAMFAAVLLSVIAAGGVACPLEPKISGLVKFFVNGVVPLRRLAT